MNSDRRIELSEVVIRLARSDERRKWDALMDAHHYLGFRYFAGRGLRYIAELNGEWLALSGWQTGAFRCRPRDQWIGWIAAQQDRRLHLIANNTRFLILPAAQGVRNLGSHVLGRTLRMLSADWLEEFGHCLELAETFVDPKHFHGGVYDAANWIRVGKSKGFARHNGTYSAGTHPKEMLVYPLHKRAQQRLRAVEDQRNWSAKPGRGRFSTSDTLALLGEFKRLGDFRRAQGRKHGIAAVLAVCTMARVLGHSGPRATAQYARALDQKTLHLLRCWRNPKTDLLEPPSQGTIQRVLTETDPDALQQAIARWCAKRCAGDALAGDGKRIRGANRNADDCHYETATLVAHGTGAPLVSRTFAEQGGEGAAMLALLEDIDVSGKVITLDALHTTRALARTIVNTHGADYVLTVKRNCPKTHDALVSVVWERDADNRHAGCAEKQHGRIERRSIETLDAPRFLEFPHVRQAFRITRSRTIVKTGKETITHAYGFSSLTPEQASPQRLLELNRGHWAVEARNHYRRDVSFGEDACRMRTRHGPANNAAITNAALAIILHAGFEYAPDAFRHYQARHDDAIDAVTR